MWKAWDISVELWPTVEEFSRHSPGANVADTGFKSFREAEAPGFGISSIGIAKLKRPEEAQGRGEEVPKDVGTVAVLGEDETLAYARPGSGV